MSLLGRDPAKVKTWMRQEFLFVMGASPDMQHFVVREHCEELERLWKAEDWIGLEMIEEGNQWAKRQA